MALQRAARDNVMGQKQFKTSLLLSLIAGLAWLNWTIGQLHIDISPLATETPPQAHSGAHVDVELAEAVSLSLADFKETVQRPLFLESRRPFTPQPGAPPVTEATSEAAATPILQSASNLQVFGVIYSEGGKRKALLREAQAKTGLWLDPGNMIDGWRIRTIEDRQVVVERDGTTEVLTLHKFFAVGQR